MSSLAGGHHALIDVVTAEGFHLAHPRQGDLQPGGRLCTQTCAGVKGRDTSPLNWDALPYK